MSQDAVIRKINRKYGKAAKKLGASCQVYRPGISAIAPVVHPANQITTIMAAFDASPSYHYTKPSGYKFPEQWYGLFDAYTADLKIGDVLVEPKLGVFFIASLEPVHAIHCVRCQHVVDVRRPEQLIRAGAGPYSGLQSDRETVLFEGVPAAFELDRTGNVPAARLPGDTVGQPTWRTFLPPSACPEGSVNEHDVLVNQDNKRFQVIAAYWCAQGYELRTRLFGA